MRAIFVGGVLDGCRKQVDEDITTVKEVRYSARPYPDHPAYQIPSKREYKYTRQSVVNLGEPVAYFLLQQGSDDLGNTALLRNLAAQQPNQQGLRALQAQSGVMGGGGGFAI